MQEDEAIQLIGKTFPSRPPDATPLMELVPRLLRKVQHDPFPEPTQESIATGVAGLDLLLGRIGVRDSILITGTEPAEVRDLALSFVARLLTVAPNPVLYISLRETALQVCEQMAQLGIADESDSTPFWNLPIDSTFGSNGETLKDLPKMFFYDQRPIDIVRSIEEFRPEIQLQCIILDDAATLRSLIPESEFNVRWDAIRLAAANRKAPLITIGGMVKEDRFNPYYEVRVALEDFPIDKVRVLLHLERGAGTMRRLVVFKPGEALFGVVPLRRNDPHGHFRCGNWHHQPFENDNANRS